MDLGLIAADILANAEATIPVGVAALFIGWKLARKVIGFFM